MKARITLDSLRTRTERAAAIFAKSSVLDCAMVATDLQAFRDVHQDLAAAAANLDDAESLVSMLRERLALLDAEQDRAVERLAGYLAAEGHSRRNPFAKFSHHTPFTLSHLPVAEESSEIHLLIGAVTVSASSRPVTEAARQAEAAASATDAVVAELATAESAARNARSACEVVVSRWDASLRALNLSARAAAWKGNRLIADALFGTPKAARKKTLPSTSTPEVA